MFGWQSYPLEITRERRPEVRVLDSDGKPLDESRYDVTYQYRKTQTIIVPITGEFYVDRLLNREEFRKVVRYIRYEDGGAAECGGGGMRGEFAKGVVQSEEKTGYTKQETDTPAIFVME